MKIVVLDGYASNPNDLSWEELESLGGLTVYERTPKELAPERIGDADAIFTNKVAITREILQACPNLKYVGVLATGYNIIDTAAAREHGVTVTNVPAYSTEAVAQMVIAFLLEICNHVAAHSQAVYSGEWQSCPDFCFWKYPLIELKGKTMGIIGFGSIGKAVGHIAKALGMNVIVTGSRETADGREIAEYVSFDELLRQADVISIHCPLFDATQGIINKDSIAKMKDGVILINTARGPIIVEQDVADALNSGKIYAAGIDVVSAEPIKGENPLLKAKNCFITPHIAWAPLETRERLIKIAIGNLRAFLSGEPVNVVNP